MRWRDTTHKAGGVKRERLVKRKRKEPRIMFVLAQPLKTDSLYVRTCLTPGLDGEPKTAKLLSCFTPFRIFWPNINSDICPLGPSNIIYDEQTDTSIQNSKSYFSCETCLNALSPFAMNCIGKGLAVTRLSVIVETNVHTHLRSLSEDRGFSAIWNLWTNYEAQVIACLKICEVIFANPGS